MSDSRGIESGRNAVLLITADTAIGLCVMRSLTRRGVPVYCARVAKDALGPRSRFCAGWFDLPQGDAALAAIVEHAGRWGITHLAAVSENHIALLNRHREALAERFTLLFPPQDVFERASRKHLTLECARRAGIRIPLTAYPQTMEEAESCREMEYPVVLKMSHRDFPDGTTDATKAAFEHKSLKVGGYDELKGVLGALPPGQYPMVQEYIPGGGVGMSMLMRGGRAVLAFQHRRLREYPPEGGVSVYCEAMTVDPKVFEQSERLLQEMQWDGVAMVEYRGDPETGRYALMEVNGRFWGSLPTAVAAGADFPYWLYRTSFPGLAELPKQEYRTGLRARSLAGDTKWLLNVVGKRTRNPVRAVVEYLAAFRPSTRYFIWDWADPKPAIYNFLGRFVRR